MQNKHTFINWEGARVAMLQIELPHIGLYTPVRTLGAGSTTFTHLYRHEQRKKYVVIKLTRAPLITLEEKEAFLARAKLLKKLKHRNMDEVIDYGLLPSGDPADDYGYLAVQYIEGSTIRERFAPGQTSTPDEVRSTLFPLADTLQYAHKMFAVHGNLHPGNVLLAGKDIFLTDFSLSTQASPTPDTQATLYRAPEHLRGTASAASDQYSLAVMVYEWLCGRRPYSASSPEELLFQQEHEPLPTPGSLNPEIKPRIEEILLQALSIDPAARFPHMLTFSDAYLRALMGLPFITPVANAPQAHSSAPSTPIPPEANTPVPSTPRDLSAIPARKNATQKKLLVTPAPPTYTMQTSAENHPASLQPPSHQTLTNQVRKETPAEGGSEPATQLTSRSRSTRKRPKPAASDQPEGTASTNSVSAPQQFEQADQLVPIHPPPMPISPEQSRYTGTTRSATGAELAKIALSPLPGSSSDLQHRVEADLRQGGALSNSLSGYEERPAQIEMARLVARSLNENSPALVEAGTGTGKSLAYLLPIVRSGKVAIISTANKALQEQLYFKDIPFVQRHIRHFDAALVKGMNNYICLDRLEQERVGIQHYVKNRDFMRLLERIEESDERFTGDFETLGFTLPGDIRGKVNADRDQCTWSKCGYFSDCYVRRMKARAGQASVIVVNHTLLLLDALMEGYLLPERDVIVVDEAHHLEEEATRAFTVTVSQGQVVTLLAQHMLKEHTPPALQEEARATMALAWERLLVVADPGFKGRANLKEPLQEGLGLSSVLTRLADALRTGRPKDMTERDEQLYDKLLSRAQNLAEDVRKVFAVEQGGRYVYYVERVNSGGRRGLQQLEVSAAPLEVTSWLKEQLFDKSNVICTSATLATIGPDPAHPETKGPNFAYFRRRVGLSAEDYPDVQERILPLTFDYHSQALLYLPRHLPEPVYGAGPAAQAYTQAIAQEMMRLVEASRGRAFLLFSSKRMLDEVFEIFQRDLPNHLTFPLLRQGDMTRMELVRSFRERSGAVLFGLKSFWEGVDIIGEALSLVVIDKLPFDPPDDPVHEARVAQMKAAGENWFGTYVLPQTVLRLKQGLGRLLRSHEDRGVMAILDTRLYTKNYGKQIVLALPPARRTASLNSVIQFFQPDDEEEAPF